MVSCFDEIDCTLAAFLCSSSVPLCFIQREYSSQSFTGTGKLTELVYWFYDVFYLSKCEFGRDTFHDTKIRHLTFHKKKYWKFTVTKIPFIIHPPTKAFGSPRQRTLASCYNIALHLQNLISLFFPFITKCIVNIVLKTSQKYHDTTKQYTM